MIFPVWYWTSGIQWLKIMLIIAHLKFFDWYSNVSWKKYFSYHKWNDWGFLWNDICSLKHWVLLILDSIQVQWAQHFILCPLKSFGFLNARGVFFFFVSNRQTSSELHKNARMMLCRCWRQQQQHLFSIKSQWEFCARANLINCWIAKASHFWVLIIFFFHSVEIKIIITRIHIYFCHTFKMNLNWEFTKK